MHYGTIRLGSTASGSWMNGRIAQIDDYGVDPDSVNPDGLRDAGRDCGCPTPRLETRASRLKPKQHKSSFPETFGRLRAPCDRVVKKSLPDNGPVREWSSSARTSAMGGSRADLKSPRRGAVAT
jgi:hypothetical protein